MEKNILLIFAIVLNVSAAMAQTLVAERISDLKPEDYSITGDAILQEFDDGRLTLSLSEDFDTPQGPDVRVLLGNSLSLSGAIEIVNLSTINHFNGAKTFEIPENISIEDYQFVLFFCVQFQLFWASGEFDDTTFPTPYECLETVTATSNWETEVEICATDGADDAIELKNNLAIPIGDNYAFLITDENEILQEVVWDSIYNFEGSGTVEQRVYGINYSGQLNPAIGETRKNTTATDCFIHSGDNLFLSVKKTGACATAVVDPVLSQQVEIFPNPASNFINIRLPETFSPEQISVINMLGTSLSIHPAQTASSLQQIEIPNLSTGNYIIRIENKDQIVNQILQVIN